MSQPTPYARLYNLTAYAGNNPAAPYNASQHDAEFNAIATTLSETLENLAIIQRDDGNLRFAIVTPDALNTATLNLMGDWEPKGPWLPDQVYAKKDMVTVSSTSYVCAVAHTSGTWAIDLAAGYWQPVNQGESIDFTTVQFTATDRVLGRSSPGAGSGEEIVCTAAGRGMISSQSVADMRTFLGLGTGSDPTFNNLTVANLLVSGLTASTMLYAGPSKVLTSTAAPTDGQLLIGDTGGDPVLGNITGTANRVTVTNGAGTITLSGPQDLAASSTPSFATVQFTNLSSGSVPFIGSSSALVQDNGFTYDATNNSLAVNSPIGATTMVGILTLGDRNAQNPSILFVEGGDEVQVQSVGGDLYITSDDGVSRPLLDLERTGATFGATVPVISQMHVKATFFATGAPVTETGATHTVATTTAYLICDRAGTITVTLPAAASYTGRQLTIKTIQAQQVDSNASNVVPRAGGAAGTVILPNTDGAWTTLVSDGTNWIAMAGNA